MQHLIGFMVFMCSPLQWSESYIMYSWSHGWDITVDLVYIPHKTCDNHVTEKDEVSKVEEKLIIVQTVVCLYASQRLPLAKF